MDHFFSCGLLISNIVDALALERGLSRVLPRAEAVLLGHVDQHAGAVEVLPGGDQHIFEALEHDLLDEMPEPALGAAMWTPPPT
jgi:hypothetical protein